MFPLGILEVSPMEARNLPQTIQLFSKPDPYCAVTLNGVTKKSKKKKNTYSPKWRDEEPMEFLLLDLQNSVLLITIFDGGNFGELKLKMGHCMIDFGSDD